MQKVALPSGPTVAYEDTGGDGTAIVFSHGYMMNHHMFAPQVAHFAPHWRTIAWDARGHGDTDWDGGAFSYWDSARDLLALLDHLGLDKVVHVGMSQGGLVGMRAALLAPERFFGIVQLSTQAGVAPGADDSFGRHVGGWCEEGANAERIQFMGDLILGDGVDRTYWNALWERIPREKVRDATSALMTIDELWDRLKDVTVPVCTIHGLADVATSHDLGLRTPLGVPDARGVKLIPHGPHAANLSHPARVNKAIEDFIAELIADGMPIKESHHGQ